jgi:hypothetical protein
MRFDLNNGNAKAAHGEPDYGPLFKIHPVIDLPITKFQDICTLEEQVSIDEGVYSFMFISKESSTNME